MKMETNKIKIFTLKQTSLPSKSQRVDVQNNLKQKELALNLTKILQLK